MSNVKKPATMTVELPEIPNNNDMWDLLFMSECIVRSVHKYAGYDADKAIEQRNTWRCYLLAGVTIAPDTTRGRGENIIPFNEKS